MMLWSLNLRKWDFGNVPIIIFIKAVYHYVDICITSVPLPIEEFLLLT